MMVKSNQDATLKLKRNPSDITLNEGSTFDSIDLKKYLLNPMKEPLHFTGVIGKGGLLPKGLHLSDDGVLSGSPQSGTAQPTPYAFNVTVESPSSKPLTLSLHLFIVSSLEAGEEHQEKPVEKAKKRPSVSDDLVQYFISTTALLMIFFELGRVIDIKTLGKDQIDASLHCIRKRQQLANIFDQYEQLTDQLYQSQEQLTNALVNEQEEECHRLSEQITKDDALRTQILSEEVPVLIDLEKTVDERFKLAEQHFKSIPSKERKSSAAYSDFIYLKGQLDLIKTQRSEIEQRLPTVSKTASMPKASINASSFLEETPAPVPS